jgi:hypothetical protein
MNTTATHRFAALTFAFVMTVAMLAGVNSLATSDAPDALLARVAATQSA